MASLGLISQVVCLIRQILESLSLRVRRDSKETKDKMLIRLLKVILCITKFQTHRANSFPLMGEIFMTLRGVSLTTSIMRFQTSLGSFKVKETLKILIKEALQPVI